MREMNAEQLLELYGIETPAPRRDLHDALELVSDAREILEDAGASWRILLEAHNLIESIESAL